MDRGSYVAASGGLLQLNKLDAVNNNLANINTPGFKGQMVLTDTQQFSQTLAGAVAANEPFSYDDHLRSPGVAHVRTVTDFTAGSIKGTGNPLDVALTDPKTFFVVAGDNGPEYTRAGNFTLNGEGTLVTADGKSVLGDGGQLQIIGGKAQITASGALLSDGANVGILQIVRIDNPQGMERVGNTRFKLAQGQAQPVPVESEAVPSSLEMANVSPITSVIDLINTNRAFELYTKTAQSIDQMNQQAISQVGTRR